MYKNNLLILMILIFSCSCSRCSSRVQSNANYESKTDSVRTVLKGLNFPWEILWGKDGHIWMTERKGKISKVDPATGKVVFSASIAEVVNNNNSSLITTIAKTEVVPVKES